MQYRQWANRVLGLAAVAFGGAAAFKYYHPGWWQADLALAVSEAALVGGIADWFAVTALFRKPLGFPWHTALLPRQRERVSQAVVQMVEAELLSVANLKRRLRDISLTRQLKEWVEGGAGQALLTAAGERLAAYLARLEPGSWRTQAVAWLKEQGQTQQAAKGLAALAHYLSEPERFARVWQAVLTQAVQQAAQPWVTELLEQYLTRLQQQHTRSFLAKALFWLAEQADCVDLPEAAATLQQELVVVLTAAGQPDSAAERWVQGQIQTLVARLDASDGWLRLADGWQEALAAECRQGRLADDTAQVLLQTLQSAAPLVWQHTLTRVAQAVWQRFSADAIAQEWLEERMQHMMGRLIEQEHWLIGSMVRNVLQSFSDEELNQFVEEKAGDDLQWIRINGSLVGAVVGMLLFAFIRLVYQPWLLPWLKQLWAA